MPTTPATRLIFYGASLISQALAELDKNPPPAARALLLVTLDWGRAVVEAACPEAAARIRRPHQ
uniref:hypothetical protein n=1 Tax=unclassified Streptomyces TaxID=2593676 RepID=UPI003F4984C0